MNALSFNQMLIDATSNISQKIETAIRKNYPQVTIEVMFRENGIKVAMLYYEDDRYATEFEAQTAHAKIFGLPEFFYKLDIVNGNILSINDKAFQEGDEALEIIDKWGEANVDAAIERITSHIKFQMQLIQTNNAKRYQDICDMIDDTLKECVKNGYIDEFRASCLSDFYGQLNDRNNDENWCDLDGEKPYEITPQKIRADIANKAYTIDLDIDDGIIRTKIYYNDELSGYSIDEVSGPDVIPKVDKILQDYTEEKYGKGEYREVDENEPFFKARLTAMDDLGLWQNASLDTLLKLDNEEFAKKLIDTLEKVCDLDFNERDDKISEFLKAEIDKVEKSTQAKKRKNNGNH